MVTDKYIDSLGIEKEKAEALKDALRKDSFYRNILYKIGVFPGAIETIMKTTDTTAIDTTEVDLLTEKARIEWAEFIPANKK